MVNCCETVAAVVFTAWIIKLAVELPAGTVTVAGAWLLPLSEEIVNIVSAAAVAFSVTVAVAVLPEVTGIGVI
jgi:hypothetical protein